LIHTLTEEIISLNIKMELALRQIQAMKSFESLKDYLITVDTAKVADPRPTVLKLDATQLFNPRDGFHTLEYSQAGVPFRWTGPSREFSFNVFVSRVHPVELVLRANSLLKPELQSALVLIADGEPINLSLAQEGEKWEARTVLPARMGLGATHLTFVSASVGSPPDSADTRLLGIAFCELEICPAADIAEPRPAPMLNGSALAAPFAGSRPVHPDSARRRSARASGNGHHTGASGNGHAENNGISG